MPETPPCQTQTRLPVMSELEYDMCVRLDTAEALELFLRESVWSLCEKSHQLRLKLNHPDKVSYIVDTNINYTNICASRCAFCAFWRPANSPEAYTLSMDQWERKLQEAVDAGITTVLLQGGLNPDIGLDYMVELVRRAQAYPVHLHGFSPSEIGFVAEKEGLAVVDVLKALWDAGLRTIPGGGAEILSDRLRNRYSPRKISAEGWIEVFRQAHLIGYKTTGTMMFGIGETPREIIEHLKRLRDLQDQTNGFTAFIAWDFKPHNTRLSHMKPSSPLKYLRIIAIARLFLDNFPHIQASWSSQGRAIGQLALSCGADDLGSLLLEENVMSSAGHRLKATAQEIEDMIRAAGFEPIRRNTLYQPV